MPQPGIELGPSAWHGRVTLPRRYEARLVPQSSTRVSYTYTRWHTNVQNFMGKNLFDVVHFASDLHLNRFCLIRDFAYLMEKNVHKMLKLVS